MAAFDKTGTLTEGSFKIISSDSDMAVQLAAAAEKYSSHPIAAAFADAATPYAAESAEEVAGRGIRCLADGKALLCGNAKLLSENGIAFPEKDSIYTVIYVAYDGGYVGCIEIGDGVKADAKRAVAELKRQGVEYCIMLTGDNSARAAAVAGEVGLDGFEAGLLPDGKLECAERLRRRGKLIYVGDGINDAPVMAAADCAVSMGKVGSDAAIEASDMVLVTDNLELLPKAVRIARGTRSIVFQNIAGSLRGKAGRHGARRCGAGLSADRRGGRGRRRDADRRAKLHAHETHKIRPAHGAGAGFGPPLFFCAVLPRCRKKPPEPPAFYRKKQNI